jgi:endonuclease-3
VGSRQLSDLDCADPLRQKALRVEAILDETYGRPAWSRRLEPLDELILTVLSQHTSDVNSGRAFAELKARFSTWAQVEEAPTSLVADAIRSAGLAETKAPRIQEILREVRQREGHHSLSRLEEMPTEEARVYLRSLKGVGPKTAACVLIFSLGRPVMPVDTHVHRVSTRLGLIPTGTTADAAHDLLQGLFPQESIYAVHINLIRHGRQVCHARNPECVGCPLLPECPFGQARLAALGLTERSKRPSNAA